MALIRSKGGVVLNKYLVARVFAFDDHASEARAACVAKGWEVSAVAFSAAGTLIFTACPVPSEVRGNVPRLLNMSGPLFLHELVPARPTVRHRRRELDLFGLGRGILMTEFSPDGSLLAVVGSNSNVALYDVPTATRRLAPRPRREN